MRSGPVERWPLVAWAALASVALGAGALAVAGTGEPGLRLAIRLSARESYALFVLLFAAAPLNAVWRARGTKWLLRNRRYLGVSMAVSHAGHLAFVIALARAHPLSFTRSVAPTTLIGGSIGYVLLALMTATSFDRTAALLGRRAWRALHTTGMWTLFAIFAFTYAGRAVVGPAAALPAVPLLALVGLRIFVACRRVLERYAARAGSTG